MTHGTFDDTGWIEHCGLTNKRLVYAFSLDVHYRLLVPDLRTIRLKLCAIESTECSTYHVCDDAVTRGADGALHDVPRFKIVSGDDWIDLGEAGVGVVNGVLVAQTMPAQQGALKIEYRGVAALPRGYERLRGDGEPSAVPGTAFISTRHACSDPKYSWLEQQPLFGFGQVSIGPAPAETASAESKSKPVCRLKLSFDLYSGV
jgi:Protein of unknown function (DUF3237)